MKQVEHFKTIFQLFLGFLTETGVDELRLRCLQVNGGELVVKEFQRLLDLPPAELLELVHRDGDEEDKVKYLNIFLWHQALGRIAPDMRVRYTFDESFYNWLIHRWMVANDYDWTRLKGTVVAQGKPDQSYLSQIENQLTAFESCEYLDDASHLIMLLNVIGPKITSYSGLPRVIRFTRRLIERQDDEAMNWLSLPAVVMLVHDLSFAGEESWLLFRRLVKLEHNRTIFNYHGWLLAIRMFGQPAKDELRRIDIPGGHDLLEALATT